MNVGVVLKSGSRPVPYRKWMRRESIPLGFVNGVAFNSVFVRSEIVKES